MMRKDERGNTLLEMLLVVALIGIAGGLIAPGYTILKRRSDFNAGTETAIQYLRRAQSLAQAGDSNGRFGVSVQGGTIVLFQGDSYAARNTARDETYELVSTVFVNASNDILFERLTGLPVATGTLTFQSNEISDVVISVNSEGAISY